VLLFKNTPYSGEKVSRIFDLLAASENNATTRLLTNFFKNEGIYVDEKWLEPSKRITFGTPKKEIVDSLKTHPDCALRKVAMQQYFDQNPKTGVDFVFGDLKKLFGIKRVALFDAAACTKNNDNLSYYFYQLIQDDTLYKDDKFIKTELFNTMQAFYKHQKAHDLHTVVSSQYIPDNESDEYALLLKLLDNIDLATLTDMAAKYYNNHKDQISASVETANNPKQIKN
jgi:hypothetical protein